MTGSKVVAIVSFLLLAGIARCQPSSWKKANLLYENSFKDSAAVEDWVMEGPGETLVRRGWMEMFSPDQRWHHVFWCPVDFPSRFMAEWEMQNLNPEAGLAIIFFATRGTRGEDIFDSSLPKRDGTFKYYTKDRLNGYHISYYANNPKNPDRSFSMPMRSPALINTRGWSLPIAFRKVFAVGETSACASAPKTKDCIFDHSPCLDRYCQNHFPSSSAR